MKKQITYSSSSLTMVTLFLGAVLLSSGCVSKSAYDSATADYQLVAKEKQALSSNNRMLQNRIQQLETENSAMKQHLSTTQGKLGKKNMALQEKDDRLRDTSVKLSLTSEELENRDKQLQLASMALEEKEAYLQELREIEEKNKKVYEGLVSQLNSELEANHVKIEQMKDGINLNLSQEILFNSGSANLNKEGIGVITKVSSELKSLSYQTVVSGHTDNVPISGSLAKTYPTNWDLAGARAARVVDLLEKEGVSSDKLIAVSYGQNRPVATNDDADGRNQNRRIEIRLRPLE